MTFTPGPTPNTVCTADGAVLAVPEGWVLVPPGDPALTRRMKAAGDHWIVQEKKGRKVFSKGIWAAQATVEKIRADLEAERATETRSAASSWTGEKELRPLDRAHRIGQERPVFAYRLIARDTVEEKVLELQKTKRDLADAIINADNSLI